MDFKEIVEVIENSVWRDLLSQSYSSDPLVKTNAMTELRNGINARSQSSGLNCSASDAEKILQIGLCESFESPEGVWWKLEDVIIDWFVGIKHPGLAAAAAKFYENSRPGKKVAALTILAEQNTEESIRLIANIIDKYGFPDEAIWPRFFSRLNTSANYAYLLLPQLVFKSGRYIGNVVNFVNEALKIESIEVTDLAKTHNFSVENVNRLLSELDALNSKALEPIIYREGLDKIKLELGPWLDLLGRTSAQAIPLLRSATELQDPYLVSVAVISLLRYDVVPDSSVISKIFRSAVERNNFFQVLRHIDRLDLYPNKYFTFETFAASDMASWLTVELGYEPKQLELHSMVEDENQSNGDRWCLWKFSDEDGETFSSVSGPYSRDEEIGPLYGSDTFSNFVKWESASPIEHLSEVLRTIENWRMSCVADNI